MLNDDEDDISESISKLLKMSYITVSTTILPRIIFTSLSILLKLQTDGSIEAEKYFFLIYISEISIVVCNSIASSVDVKMMSFFFKKDHMIALLFTILIFIDISRHHHIPKRFIISAYVRLYL